MTQTLIRTKVALSKKFTQFPILTPNDYRVEIQNRNTGKEMRFKNEK